jgi:resuscitation-promoting factor RpfC
MTFTSIAVGGVAKTLMAVTISLHPGAAKQAGGYTVQAGDTLSSISQHEYGTAADWPALWWINRGTVRDPDLIQAGQRLQVSGRPAVTAEMIRAAMAARPTPAVAAAPAPAADPAPATAPAEAPAPAAAPASYSGAPGSFQACVIQAESGGNAGAVNPSSGAGGLYQFLPSTWQALGYSGLPQDASVAEQNAAFQKEYAESGSSAWGPYDGC